MLITISLALSRLLLSPGNSPAGIRRRPTAISVSTPSRIHTPAEEPWGRQIPPLSKVLIIDTLTIGYVFQVKKIAGDDYTPTRDNTHTHTVYSLHMYTFYDVLVRRHMCVVRGAPVH
jgi:hypothetical protein